MFGLAVSKGNIKRSSNIFRKGDDEPRISLGMSE